MKAKSTPAYLQGRVRPGKAGRRKPHFVLTGSDRDPRAYHHVMGTSDRAAPGHMGPACATLSMRKKEVVDSQHARDMTREPSAFSRLRRFGIASGNSKAWATDK